MVTKILIIYLILKINNILIYKEGVVRFVWFSYYKTANCTTPCGVVQCGVILLAVRLYHFTGGFGAIFTVYVVYAVW